MVAATRPAHRDGRRVDQPSATLRVAGTFQQGGAQINWQQGGHVLAIWDFTIETD